MFLFVFCIVLIFCLQQLQQWSPVKETAGAPSVPPQVGYCFHSPKKHPWRPIMGYEEIEVTPM